MCVCAWFSVPPNQHLTLSKQAAALHVLMTHKRTVKPNTLGLDVERRSWRRALSQRVQPLFLKDQTPLTRTGRNSRHESVSLAAPNRRWPSINHWSTLHFVEENKKKKCCASAGLVTIPASPCCVLSLGRLLSPLSSVTLRRLLVHYNRGSQVMNICVRPAVKISLINPLDLKSEVAYLAGQHAAEALACNLLGKRHCVVVLRRGLFVPFVSLSSFCFWGFSAKCINALKGKWINNSYCSAILHESVVILARCLDFIPGEPHVFARLKTGGRRRWPELFVCLAVDLPRRLTVKFRRQPYFTHDIPSGFRVPLSGFSFLFFGYAL